MSPAPEAVRLGRRDRVGFVLSLALHAILLTILIAIWPREERINRETPEQVVTITQRPITIERRKALVSPAAAPASGGLHLASVPTPAPLALPAVLRAAKPAPRHTYVPQRTPRVAYVPHRALRAPVPAQANGRGSLGNAQLAAIDRDLGAAIASDRAAHDPLAGTTAAPDYTTKQYTDAEAFTTGELRHGGLCDPEKDWTADGYDYYFVSCNVRFPDGTFVREAVPWPIRFPPNRDPFNGTLGHQEPLAMPLPGWTLPSGEKVAKELREYALDHGVTLPGD